MGKLSLPDCLFCCLCTCPIIMNYIKKIIKIVTKFGKTCIVHTSNFSTLVTDKIYYEWQIDVKLRICRITIYLSSLKVSNLYAIAFGCYRSPNEQNWICELHTLSQILLQLVKNSHYLLARLVAKLIDN